MININLKEVFAVDNQTDLTAKLNFNFNQLLALGVGQTGATGETGPAGPAGPIGPTGNTGTAGSQIFSTSGSGFSALSEDPVDAVIGDYYISGGAIYKKTEDYETNGGEWEVISNFYDIFNQISTAGTSTWQLGAETVEATSRILAPIRAYTGYDRINSTSGTSGAWATNDPNWLNGSSGYSNSQVTVFNFDPNTAKTYSTGAANTNGYSVRIGSNRLGTSGVTDSAFPYTSLLSLYSFYETTNAGVEPEQFDSIDGNATGYRHQIELGSVDELPEKIVSTSADSKYVISPTWQNLRIRKYRKQVNTLPGEALINADFNLSSPDSPDLPALNSRFTWSISKKASSANNTGKIVQLSLSNSQIESSAQSITGIAVDGLHIKSDTYKLAIGADPNNNGTTLKNALISSDSASSINRVIFNELNVSVVTGTSSTASISGNSITSNQSLTIGTTGSLTNTVLTSGASGQSVYVISPASSQNVYLGWSTSNVTSNSWGTNSGYALKIKKNRLAAGIPFPVSTSATPAASSTDGNVLDEYLELTFVPDIGYDGTIPTAPASAIDDAVPTFDDKIGRFVKIGNLVQFSIQFSISGWQAKYPGTSSGAPISVGLSQRDVSILNYGNVSTSNTNPFSTLTFGAEPNYLYIRNIPDHFPIVYNSQSSVPFTVNITARPGEPGIRTNPFIYSWGGTANVGTAGTATTSGTSSRMWAALDPSSIHAKVTTWNDGGTTRPQIQLYGYRRVPFVGTSASPIISNVTSAVQSKVSVYDFLRPFAKTKKTFIIITGSYITNHLTASQTAPGTSEQTPEISPDTQIPPSP
jgi:hypothetical protein